MGAFQILAIVFFGLAFVGLVISIILFFNLEIVNVIGDLSGRTAKKQIEMIREQTNNISYGAHKRNQSRSSRSSIDNVLVNSPSDSLAKAQAHKSKRLRGNTNAPAAAGISGTHQTPQREVPQVKQEFRAAPGDGTVSLESLNGTDTLHSGRTDRLKKKRTQADSEAPTDVLDYGSSEKPTDVLSDNAVIPADEAPTDVLRDPSEAPTDVLSDEGATDVLSDPTEAPTGVLSDDAATDVLSDPTEAPTGVLSDNADYENDTEQQTTVLSDDSSDTTVLSPDSDNNGGFKIISDETVINTDEVIN